MQIGPVIRAGLRPLLRKYVVKKVKDWRNNPNVLTDPSIPVKSIGNLFTGSAGIAGGELCGVQIEFSEEKENTCAEGFEYRQAAGGMLEALNG